MQVNIMVAEFPGGWSNVQQSHPATNEWLRRTIVAMKSDERIKEIRPFCESGHYLPAVRNKALKVARSNGIDMVLMIDSDMHPDLPYPDAKPFWGPSFDWMMNHWDRPGCIAAPYCGVPPLENIYVFKWHSMETDEPDVSPRLDQFSRDEAAIRGGISEVAALPTGLIIIDVRVLKIIDRSRFGIKSASKGYFHYELSPDNTEVHSTEDVVFTRNASLAGAPQWCNWDSWAGHYKIKCVGKPMPIRVEDVREEYDRAERDRVSSNAKLVMVA